MRFKALEAFITLYLDLIKSHDPYESLEIAGLEELVTEYGDRIAQNSDYFELYTPCPVAQCSMFSRIVWVILRPGACSLNHQQVMARNWWVEPSSNQMVWDDLDAVLEKAYTLNLARQSLKKDRFSIPEGLNIG